MTTNVPVKADDSQLLIRLCSVGRVERSPIGFLLIRCERTSKIVRSFGLCGVALIVHGAFRILMLATLSRSHGSKISALVTTIEASPYHLAPFSEALHVTTLATCSTEFESNIPRAGSVPGSDYRRRYWK